MDLIAIQITRVRCAMATVTSTYRVCVCNATFLLCVIKKLTIPCFFGINSDVDCQGDLICEQRDAGDPVSGCSGGEASTSNTDYCVDPNAVGTGRTDTAPPATSPRTSSPPSSSPPTSSPPLSYSNSCSPTSPCAKCVGDCVS